MENRIKIFENAELGKVRVAGTSEEPLFCLSDVCKILDLHTGMTKQRLDEKGVSSIDTLTKGGIQPLIYISEKNLYKVIMRSDKPQAEPFQDWVCGEVLPSIRKTGSYSVKLKLPSYAEALRQLADKVEENERLQIENKDMKPKAEYFDEIVDRNGLTNFRDTAKLLGVSEKALIFLLIDKKYIYRDQKGKLKPIAKYVGNYLELKEWAKGENAGTQTLVTAKGRDHFLKLINNVKL